MSPTTEQNPDWRALPRRLGLSGADAALLLGYALGFVLLNRIASHWGGAAFFALWYPPAGLRFAVLSNQGTRLAPWLVVTEVAADTALAGMPLIGPGALQSVLGEMRPGLSYWAAFALVRMLMSRRTDALSSPAMTLGFVALAAPILNALLVVPFEAPLPADAGRYLIRVDMVVSLTTLAVGDVLGILVLAPPLVWLATVAAGTQRMRISLPDLRSLLENTVVLAGCMLLTVALWHAGLGAQPIPSLLAGLWIGIRHGRTAAWFVILAQSLVFLSYSATSVDDASRLQLHLGLAAVAVVTWLAGSFADAQREAAQLLDRRNRMLFQAERLKTLRAMSVAVIHEISQPLSTLALEASQLKAAAGGMEPGLAASAILIDRKAKALSELVRRLRRFGGRDVDEPSLLPVSMLLDTARQIVNPELRARGVHLLAPPGSAFHDLVVQAQEIELTQALVNLLRNAIVATTDGTVTLAAHADDDEVVIEIFNPGGPPPASGPDGGMGVGLIIARTIVEAHGGTLARQDRGQDVCFVMSLPRAGPPA